MTRLPLALTLTALGLGGTFPATTEAARLGREVVPTFQAVELFTIPASLTRTASGSDRAFRWMTEDYSTLAERLPPEFMGFMPYFAGGCSAERLESARAFFGEPEHQATGTTRMVGRVAAQVDECLALRARAGDSARHYLERAQP